MALGEMQSPGELIPNELAWIRRMNPEYGNLRSALAWSQTLVTDSETSLRLIDVLESLWYYRGVRHEAMVELERALYHPLGIGHTAAHANAHRLLAEFLSLTGNYAAARPHFEHALSLAYEHHDTKGVGWITARLGWLAREQGDSTTAWKQLNAGLAISRELGDADGIMTALNTMAEVAIVDEDPARAEALLTEGGVTEQPERAGANLVGWTLNHFGHAAQLRGDYQHAAQLHHESLAVFQTLSDQNFGLPWAYQSLGETALGLGNLDEAAQWLTQGLALSQTLSDQASMAWCPAGLGTTAALDEEPERAARLWGAAEQLRQTIGCRSAPAARATYERALAVACTQLDEDAFAAAWAAGRALTLEQAVGEALNR